ncbi:MAG TPA: hypothetical protein VGQ99_09390, partial [Tepidisphaeraceae bacterium]|nr:hypothetical protein [Tepidisphaeraceae bacterium]
VHVNRGEPIALAGHSSFETRADSGFHVHFEVKDTPTLGNPTDEYWGYTPGNPILYGFHDPREYLQSISIQTISPIVVSNTSTSNVNIRPTFGTTYENVAMPVEATMTPGQQYVATRSAVYAGATWYFVTLPSWNRPFDGSQYPNNGRNGGWVSGGVVSTGVSGQMIAAIADGVRIRKGPGTNFEVAGKAFLGDRFVTFGVPMSGQGSTKPWYKIYFPTKSGVTDVTEGWISGDYANLISGATPDTISPTVTDFGMIRSTLQSVNVSYNVSDTGGAGLNRVELWRANDNNGVPGVWAETDRVNLSGSQANGSFTDTPVCGTKYWYGIHVVDNAGNYNTEKNEFTGYLPRRFDPLKTETAFPDRVGSITFAGFPSNTTSLQLNGGATLTGGRLRLTDSLDFLSGSVFLSEMRRIDNWIASFDFQITNSTGADGFAFVIQTVGKQAIGGVGGGLGYAGMPASLGLKFDFYSDPFDPPASRIDHTGIYLNGAEVYNDIVGNGINSGIDVRPYGIDFDGLNPGISGNGAVYRVTLKYDGVTLEQTITDINNSSKSITARYTIDIPATIQGECAYVGFTGATGGLHARQEILNFDFRPGTDLTDLQKQQSILEMVNAHRGSIPAELVLAVIFQEGGQGAFHVNGWAFNSNFYLESNAPWAQPTNGDGIMQVTTNSGMHEHSGTYTHDQTGYDHAVNDGSSYLLAQQTNHGTLWQAVLHYNTGPSSLFVYKGLNAGDRRYLAHVASNLRTLVPPMFNLSNQELADKLDAAQSILNIYLNDSAILSAQPASYYTSFQQQLDQQLHDLLIGDVNFDRSVSISDFIDLASNFNKSNATWSDGDLNGDGSVTISDFIDLASHFNQSLAGTVTPIDTPQSALSTSPDSSLEQPLLTSPDPLSTLQSNRHPRKHSHHRIHPRHQLRHLPHLLLPTRR